MVAQVWFDGHILANYLVSTAKFTHPISRRALTRAECGALDECSPGCREATLMSRPQPPIILVSRPSFFPGSPGYALHPSAQ